MSASSKKKLRREQEAAKMTEKQLNERKEASKTKLYTTAFVAVMVVLLVIAITVGVTQTITSSGIREKNTTALTVGDHEISNAQLNYYFMDAVNNFYSNYGSYASMFGLDVTKPLNEQVVDETTGQTWADDFMESAKETVKATYALADAAQAAGHTLTQEELDTIDANIENLNTYAVLYGYSDGEAYLKAIYGNGASTKGYKEYSKLNALASSYYNHYSESLTYEDADLRAAEAETFGAYSSYTYNAYYIPSSRFLEGGTTDEEGNTTYSDEEKAASVAAAEEAANSLMDEEITDVAALDAAIAALEINAGSTASSTAYEDTLYASVNSLYADWISDAGRKAGDKAVFANTSTTTAEDSTETTTTSGYYVVIYLGSNENRFPLKNVRHILVTPEHTHEEGETHADGETYSQEELAAAKANAEAILTEWEEGGATEELFAELANNKSADSDGISGGLYENIYPGQMVEAFENWCYDESRKSGDTGIVETEYGYHVMYFVGNSEQTYRDYQIENELRTSDLDAWYTENVEAMTLTEGDIKYVNTALVLSPAA